MEVAKLFSSDNIILYIATLAVFLALDALWLFTVGGSFFKSQLAYHLKEQIDYGPAFFFYVFFAFGLVYFAVHPAFQVNSWSVAFFHGCFIGLLAYAAYDLTNLSTLKEYPLAVAAVDMTWGTLLSGVSSLSAYLIGQSLLR